LAKFSTCLAILVGKVTLRRTCLIGTVFARERLAIGMVAPVYTIVVHTNPMSRKGGETWGTAEFVVAAPAPWKSAKERGTPV
jgi:hypothetical protein